MLDMHSSSIASILRSSAELTEPIHIFGTTPPTRAFLIARYFQALHPGHQPENYLKQPPLVVLCPTDDDALELQTNLESLASTLTETSLQICYFPTWEQSPFCSITPSLKTRFERLAVLSSLANGHPPDLIITTIPASCQASLPKSIFQNISLLAETNQTIQGRESLIARLQEAGYLRVDPVEDPGTYAVRGDIIDVFPPDSHYPYRIELFGDLIEKIRTFDPNSQRTHPSKPE